MSVESLELGLIRLDRDAQPRVEMSAELVEEYAQEMAEGAEFPPVSVVHDGRKYWLYDGFHRYMAASQLGRERIAADVKEGAYEDAVWLSLGANKAHGMRRRKEDKANAIRKAVALRHDKSDREVALHIGVDNKTVAKYRSQLVSVEEIPQLNHRQGSDGKWYKAHRSVPNDDFSRSPSGQPMLQPLKYTEDARNNPFPDGHQMRLAEVFSARPRILKLCQDIRNTQDEAGGLQEEGGEAGQRLAQSPFFDLMQDAAGALIAICPYAVCPNCDADGCQSCNNRGWLDERSWQERHGKPAAQAAEESA